MNAGDLVLNIAVNLNRISRFAMDGNEKRMNFFIHENDKYISEVNNLKLSSNFKKTFNKFRSDMLKLKNTNKYDDEWSEEVLTWANILTHRAKLA